MSRTYQPLAEGLKYTYVKGERRLASATTGKVLTKAEEAKDRAEQKKKSKWDLVLSKYIDVSKHNGEDDHPTSGGGDGGGVTAAPIRVYTEAERQANIRSLGEEIAQLRKAAYLAPQQKERKQTLDRLMCSLKSRGATIIIPGEDSSEGSPGGNKLGQKRGRDEEEGDADGVGAGGGDQEAGLLDAEDEAALLALLREQQSKGGSTSTTHNAADDAEALEALREKRKQHHQDIQSFLYGGGGSSSSQAPDGGGVKLGAAEMSAAQRIVSLQLSGGAAGMDEGPVSSSTIHRIHIGGGGTNGPSSSPSSSSFVPRSVAKKQHRATLAASAAATAAVAQAAADLAAVKQQNTSHSSSHLTRPSPSTTTTPSVYGGGATLSVGTAAAEVQKSTITFEEQVTGEEGDNNDSDDVDNFLNELESDN